MTRFEVWSEKTSETYAVFIGEADAENFCEACDKVCHPDSSWRNLYDKSTRTIWGKQLFPSQVEANGYKRSWSYTTGEELIIKVGEREVLRLPYRAMDNCTGICFPEAGWLAGKIKDMIDQINFERYKQ